LTFERANREFIHGDLQESWNDARKAYDECRDSSPQWASRFKILEARAALWQGLFPDVITLLGSAPQNAPSELDIPRLALLGVAHAHLQEYSDSEPLLSRAAELCTTHDDSACGDVLQARGLLASEQGNSSAAGEFFKLSLSFARARNDAFLEATSLLNLGAEALAQGRFDEAIDQSEAAYRVAETLGARWPRATSDGLAIGLEIQTRPWNCFSTPKSMPAPGKIS
jgi:tetratricopeptide (TPR) repeat protein